MLAWTLRQRMHYTLCAVFKAVLYVREATGKPSELPLLTVPIIDRTLPHKFGEIRPLFCINCLWWRAEKPHILCPYLPKYGLI